MASPRKSGEERLVSRTYRAAIRLGEDFITLEETITLPLDASDEEVAGLIGFLCSPAAAFMTGQSINIDGGVVMW